MKTQMLCSLKGQNMYLKGETFEDNDSNYLFYEVVNSIKITFPRKHISGSLLDNDIYGCQQHVPLANIEL